MDINTIFDGWGTELISIMIGILFAGGIGFWCYKKGKSTQKQKAGKNSKQHQEIKSSDGKNVNQSQVARDDSEQTQIG
jgi:hypothetical protein